MFDRIFIRKLIKEHFNNAFLLSFPQVIGIAIGLISLPIILANLNPEDYGALQFILAIQMWLSAMTAGNITTGSKKGIANNLKGTFLYAFLYRLKFFIAVGIMGFIISAYFYFSHQSSLALLMAIISGYMLIGYHPQVSYAEFLVAEKKFKEFFWWQIIFAIIIPALSVLAAFLTKDIHIFTAVQYGSITMLSLIALIRLVHKNNLIVAYRDDLIDRDCIKYGLKLIPSDLLLATSNQLSSFIIGPLFGFANLAVFSIASRMDSSFKGLLRISYNLLYSDFAKQKMDGLIRTIQGKLQVIFIYSFIASMLCLLIGGFYIKIFLPIEYHPSFIYLAIMTLAFPPFVAQSILRTVLDANLRHKEINTLTVISSLIRISTLLLFGFFFKIIGIVIALTIITWMEFYFYYYVTMKKLQTQPDIADLLT